ncbi:DUF408 domain-containing protein [Plectosphaerella cucumerina]|uniref:RNA polymerase II subunit B1 CTD phosphatase RPAP2 homolog n=1 Tax=Plectosphaerella cucumerina TaxID=40658 RepID=A0A8K0T6G8_9PEZI|nr:DUF408 domain-containing protein [Plectosphaerella cucumerina]
MASEKTIKGILKNAVHGEQPSRRRPDPREVAIQHARILQQRKDLELQILSSIEVLSFFPQVRAPEYTSATPSTTDVAGFKAHVRLFQPGDYEDLIEERNANNLCGYTLCPNPKPKPAPGGAWKLLNVGRSDFQIVDKKELERWCSTACKKRALYVKVQLNETAAWERIGIPDIGIETYDETNMQTKTPAPDSKSQKPPNEVKTAEDAAALALERGDVGATSSRMMNLTIREKVVQQPAEFPQGGDSDDEDSAMAIEGYTPNTGKAK